MIAKRFIRPPQLAHNTGPAKASFQPGDGVPKVGSSGRGEAGLEAGVPIEAAYNAITQIEKPMTRARPIAMQITRSLPISAWKWFGARVFRANSQVSKALPPSIPAF